jgi:twinkle protein
LYGQWLWSAGNAKMLVIVEGEIDACSMSQAQGNRFPVVSVPNGCQGAKRAVQNSLEFVESFDRVVIMLDNDDVGRAASVEIAELLTPSKAAIATLPLKDPNEMLVAGRTKELIDAMWQAKVHRPDGILAGTDLWDDVSIDADTPSIPYPFQALNIKTHGIRRGELVTICAGSGVGKSQVCKEIAYHLINQGQSIGYIALEENVKRTALGLMGLALDKPLHLTKEGVSDDDLRSAFDLTVGSGSVYLYDHFGSLETDNLLNKVRYLAKGCGVSYVILDHLSIVVSGIDDGDERKNIDVVMTKLRSLCEETGIGLILVSHLRRPSGERGWENGLEVTLNSLRGSASIAQLSDMCLSVERDQQGDNPNQSTVRVLKNRFSGETGIGCLLNYNIDTGRMTEVTQASVFEVEEQHDDF